MTVDDSIQDHALDAEILLATEADVRGFFTLALGRDPESAEVLALFRNNPIHSLVRQFFGCEEFAIRIVKPLATGKRPPIGHGAVPAALLAWAARRLPLAPASAHQLAAARSWYGAYAILLTDEVFCGAVGEGAEVLDADIVEAIRTGATLQGAIEAIESGWLRGWALKTDAPDQPLDLEVWVNGALVRAARADLFRRDIQDRFGGPGLAGFELQLPEGFDERSHTNIVEIRDRVSALVIADARIARQTGAPNLVAGIRAELVQIEGLLKSIQDRLPQLDRSLSTSLEDYSEYAEAWRRFPATLGEDEGQSLGDQTLGVVVDAGSSPARWLEDCVASLLAQRGWQGPIVVVMTSSKISFGADLANRAAWRGVPITVVEADDLSVAERFLKGVDALPPFIDKVVLVSGNDALAPDAVHAFASAFEGETRPDAVYGDADQFAPEDIDSDFRIRRRDRPLLRPAFDQDLLLQTPYTGQVAAFRRTVLADLGLRPEAGRLCVSDALLRLGHGVGHIDRVLTTSQAENGPDSDLWKKCVEFSVAADSSVTVETHGDILGAQVAGAVRPRRSFRKAKATVIVPTRDALDMLRPCLESLFKHRGDNRTEMDVLVIDHESRDPETLAYLEELAVSGRIRIMPFEGEFNWALMNNLAAAISDADVLVFLNNDTVVVSPDWLDELTSQALRPDVGVVGARLIFEDGTIQHAGFVTRGADYMFLVHEGVGRPGSDPGYMGRHSLLRSAAAVTGACIAVRSEVFRSLGGFDSANLPLEANDVDLCFRARTSGLKVLYDPYVTLFHYESKTRGFSFEGERRRIAVAASQLMWTRWGAQFGQDIFYNSHFDRESRPFTRLRPPRALVG